MSYVPDGEEEPAPVRRLRIMVMALIVVLIVGFIFMVGTIVVRLGLGGEPPVPVTAEAFNLPTGKITATGRGTETVMFVVEHEGAEVLLLYDAETGELESETPIRRD